MGGSVGGYSASARQCETRFASDGVLRNGLCAGVRVSITWSRPPHEGSSTSTGAAAGLGARAL